LITGDFKVSPALADRVDQSNFPAAPEAADGLPVRAGSCAAPAC